MVFRPSMMACMLTCGVLFHAGAVENQQNTGKGLIWPKPEKISQVQENPGATLVAERGMEFRIPSRWKRVATDTEVKGHGLTCRTGFLSFELPDVGTVSIWLGPKLSTEIVWKDLETRVCEMVPEGSVVKRVELKIKSKGEYPLILTYKGSAVKKGVKQDAYFVYGYKEPGIFSPTLGTYKVFARISNPEKISEVEHDIHFVASTFVHRPGSEIDAASLEFLKEALKDVLKK